LQCPTFTHRDNLRLKGDKLNDTRTMTKMQKQIRDLEQRLTKQSNKSQELHFQLQEQRSQATGDQTVIEGLKGKIAHLETAAFVMGDRAKRFEEEVEPRRQEVAHLTSQRLHQDRELGRTLRMVNSLKHAVTNKGEQVECGSAATHSMQCQQSRARSSACIRAAGSSRAPAKRSGTKRQ
jgi:predicted  nucleic acid-binding Zn-ribbon protein